MLLKLPKGISSGISISSKLYMQRMSNEETYTCTRAHVMFALYRVPYITRNRLHTNFSGLVLQYYNIASCRY